MTNTNDPLGRTDMNNVFITHGKVKLSIAQHWGDDNLLAQEVGVIEGGCVTKVYPYGGTLGDLASVLVQIEAELNIKENTNE